ncbi:putative membrane protein [Volucribacter psittacicida]|uniref:Putative membrane protein n=1 Tax=Volucribacter psittacicida TaxID=203482 RepID=A0A4R1FV84_9PAST|nr:PACE efflux transporter [Volucribacter psittacicida]TCJ98773.1 putative membrane protein [Volucribacter psittacicida]
MPLKERIFHAILFEIGAISVSALAVMLTGQATAQTAFTTTFLIGTIAMFWNFVFNYFFDKWATGKREQRSVKLRIFHTLSFEGGLLLFTIPVIAYFLQLTWLQALLADIGLTLLITVYAFFFNWGYDLLRVKVWVGD